MQRCLLELKLFFIAVQFLTRVPVPQWVGFQPSYLQHCLRYFPVVGALVGLAGAGVLLAASLWWPPLVAVLLSMAFTVWLTGAFHEDGWADSCDGLGGAVSRERALAIMKDSRIGSYGAVGLVLMLGLKAAILSSLLGPQWHGSIGQTQQTPQIQHVLLGWTAMALVWSHATSRWLPVCLMYALPYAGDAEHAKAKPLATQVGGANVLAATALWVLLVLLMMAWVNHVGWPLGTLYTAMGWATLASTLVCAWVWRWLRRRLGGYTGDTLGAAQQLCEVASLLAWLAVVHPNTWMRW